MASVKLSDHVMEYPREASGHSAYKNNHCASQERTSELEEKRRGMGERGGRGG